MTKNPEKEAVHIDIVNSKDKSVLLAHTRETFSIGFIHDLDLICFLPKPYNRHVGKPPSLALAHIPDEETSLDFLGQLVNDWSSGQPILSFSDFKNTPTYNEPPTLYYFLRDARIDEPQLTRDGQTKLPLSEELDAQKALLRFQEVGVFISIESIIQYFNSLINGSKD